MSAVAPSHPMVGIPPFPVRKLSVEEYHALIRDGFFTEDERFELLEGWVVPKMSRNPPHDVAIDKTQDQLRSRLAAKWRVRIQSAITTADSEPEPDLAIVLGPADRYAAHHPHPDEIALLIEVANTTLDTDRSVKTRTYARAGIPIYWIINLVDRVVEVNTNPSGPSGLPAYATRELFTASDTLPLVVAGQEVSRIVVADLLP